MTGVDVPRSVDVLRRNFRRYKEGSDVVRLEILSEEMDNLDGGLGTSYTAKVVEIMSSERRSSDLLGLEYVLFVPEGSKTDCKREDKSGTLLDY